MDSQPDSSEGDGSGSQPSQGSSVMTVVPESSRREILYFAYGSNLSTEQMHHRCPHSTPIGLAWLPGWRWLINERGYANLVPLLDHQQQQQQQQQKGSSSMGAEAGAATATSDNAGYAGVYGLLYFLPPQDEASLDRCEGVPWAYEKMRCEARWVRDADARPVVGLDAVHDGRSQDAAGDGRQAGEEWAAVGRPVSALVYVDRKRTGEGPPREEYVGRMKTAIADAVSNWGLDEDYANRVMRRFLVGKRVKGGKGSTR